MFYAHFVLTKKGPLARIWLAAHWDKKLTKAHVFETNIDHSVEAILEPKVKLALRTSGHLLLGVVRIYSRKAKYLLSDCNEAFVKIKMAFRPGVVDLPEENREAAVAAITLQENFHDFDSFADLSDIDVHVNQSRPEEITMREDLGNIQLVGDDGFGDVFDEREMARDASNLDNTLYKSPQHGQLFEKSKSIDISNEQQPMDIDLNAPVTDDGFGAGLDDGAFIAGGHEDDSSDDDNFGGDVDQEFFGDNFIDAGGLFEEPTPAEVPLVPEVDAQGPTTSLSDQVKDVDGVEAEGAIPAAAGAAQAEQTTLVHNEEEAFALEPIDVTAYTGVDRPTRKRKRKLVVDESKGIQSESMKMQLSDTTDIISTLDLAPPTKKLMHWKETGGVDRLFSLSSRADRSKPTIKLFTRNLVTKHVDEGLDIDIPLQQDTTLEPPEIARDDQQIPSSEELHVANDISRVDITAQSDMSLAPNADLSLATTADLNILDPAADESRKSLNELQQADIFGTSNLDASMVNVPPDPVLDTRYLDDEPPSIAPFSVAPPSVAPPSVAPMSVPPVFEDVEEVGETMPENEEQEEKRLTKRTHQMQHTLERSFRQHSEVYFSDLTRGHYRKQMAAKFYTLLVLKKSQCLSVQQDSPFGDITLTKGRNFALVS